MLKPIAAGERVVARIPIRFVRRAFRRVPSSTPKTALRITSSVIDCMLGWSRNSVADGPRVDLAIGGLRHHGLVGAHPLAVERGQHQLAPAQVFVALLEQ